MAFLNCIAPGGHAYDADKVANFNYRVGQRMAGLCIHALNDIRAGNPWLAVLPHHMILILEPQLIGIASKLVHTFQLQRAIVQGRRWSFPLFLTIFVFART